MHSDQSDTLDPLATPAEAVAFAEGTVAMIDELWSYVFPPWRWPRWHRLQRRMRRRRACSRCWLEVRRSLGSGPFGGAR